MSYDATIVNHAGEELVDAGNYTYNTGEMWSRALTAVTGEPMRLSDLDTALVADVARPLADAVVWMYEHREELLLLEPANRWGSFDGAVEFLSKIRDGALTHYHTPNARLRVV